MQHSKVEQFLTLTKDAVRPTGPALQQELSRRPLQIAVWVAKSDWAAANGSLVRAFGRVITKTATWASANHPKTAAILADVTKMNADLTQTMARAAFATRLDAAEMQPVADLAVAYGALAQLLAIDRHVFP